ERERYRVEAVGDGYSADLLGAEDGEVVAAEAEGESDRGAEGADGGGFGEHRTSELAAAGADGAEDAEFAASLGDGHREGVEDGEGCAEDDDEFDRVEHRADLFTGAFGFGRGSGAGEEAGVATRGGDPSGDGGANEG